MVENLAAFLFDRLHPVTLPPDLRDTTYAIVQAPVFESTSVRWLPILLGHELAHLSDGVDLAFDTIRGRIESISVEAIDDAVSQFTEVDSRHTAVAKLEEIAHKWTLELACDAYATKCYGPAAFLAFSDFFEYTSDRSFFSGSHPPTNLRLELMGSWIGGSAGPLSNLMGAWRDPFSLDEPLPLWATELERVLKSERAAESIFETANELDSVGRYSALERTPYLEQLCAELLAGRPCALAHIEGSAESVVVADAINSCWLAESKGSDLPIELLAQKGLADLEFVRRWRGADGIWPPIETPSNASLDQGVDPLGQGVLVKNDVFSRLVDDDNDLAIVPLLASAVGSAAIDLRLSNQFIVFERSATSSLRPLDTKSDPRAVQKFVDLNWGAEFVLHPNELVLAATLEYLVLPSDLSGQVMTRSSYGRLGLLSATAVQIHPGFHGCLTLELANLSGVPVVLSPGERIAQLILSTTTQAVVAPTTPVEKYRYPTGPQFSRSSRDDESQILMRFK